MSIESQENTLRRIVGKLVSEYAPQKVVLFGSYAYGTPDRDSDIDLLIIKDTEEAFFDRMARVRRTVSGTHQGIPFDPLVLTPKELEQRLRVGDHFFQDILERGRVLYDR